MPKDQIQEDKESEPRSDRNYAKRPSMKLSAQNLYKPSTPTKLYEEDSESQKDNNNNNVISSNYLIVSGEHSVHFNTNVCSRFCCTTHPFQAFGYPLLLLYMGGFGFHPSLSTGVRATAAVYFKAISPMTQFHRFLISLHMHDNLTYSFRISPCPLCSLLRISGLRYSSEIGSSQGVFYVY